MEVGRWKLGDGSWEMEVGRWKLGDRKPPILQTSNF
jgi:hypothetical protein